MMKELPLKFDVMKAYGPGDFPQTEADRVARMVEGMAIVEARGRDRHRHLGHLVDRPVSPGR